VSPTATLDILETRKISCPKRELKPRPSNLVTVPTILLTSTTVSVITGNKK
jgi:hypothetical protein